MSGAFRMLRCITVRMIVWSCVVSTASTVIPELLRAQGGTPGQRITYDPTDENFPNPERGYHITLKPLGVGYGRAALDERALGALRARGTTLVQVFFVIDEFRQAPLSRDALDAIAADFATARRAGVKLIPRFAYVFPCEGATEPCNPVAGDHPDAPLARVLEHIDQLAPVLRANADVIAFMQAGFVGVWGEWFESSNALVNGDRTVNANSTAIVERLLWALPPTRMIAMRFPIQKQGLFGATPLPAARAFDGSPASRVGHHNDCLGCGYSDGTTYDRPGTGPPAKNHRVLKKYVALENRFVPQDGETASFADFVQPFISCSNMLKELAQMRWTTVSEEYNINVIALWRQQGCFPEIGKRLGYRFRLVDATLVQRVAPGGLLELRLTIANDGWATPYNPRNVELILRHAATGRRYVVPVAADPRLWHPGMLHAVEVRHPVAEGIEPGTYDVLLNLNDPESTLSTRPEYSLRFANTGTWEAATGYNSLRAQVLITGGAPVSPPTGLTAAAAGSTVTLTWIAPTTGSPPDSYIIEAGSSSGLANLASFSTGTAATTFSAGAVPAGTYYVRVRSQSGASSSGPSNEVVVVVTPP